MKGSATAEASATLRAGQPSSCCQARNSTNRCVNVINVSPDNGCGLQLWDCLGAGQYNQHWRREPIAGQPPWYALIARHSNRCMDDLGWSTSQGTRIGQWDCLWGGNQQWNLQGVIEP